MPHFISCVFLARHSSKSPVLKLAQVAFTFSLTVFDPDSRRSMQEGYTFNDLCVYQEEFSYRQSKSNRLCHPLQNYSSEPNSCCFVSMEWNHTEPDIREDYSPYDNNPSMYLADSPETDCSAQPGVGNTMPNGSYDVEVLSGNDIVDCGLNQTFPTLEYVDEATIEGCYKNKLHPDSARVACFESFEDRCENLFEDTQQFWEQGCNITVPSSFATFGQFSQALQNMLVFVNFSENDQVFERPTHLLDDENCCSNTEYAWNDNTSRDVLDGFPESQCNTQVNKQRKVEPKTFLTETQPDSQLLTESQPDTQLLTESQPDTQLLTESQPDTQLLTETQQERLNVGTDDARYWKRREKNNEAAKRSRTAKKSRLAFMERRIKELEVENAEKKEHVRILKQKIFEKEGKSELT